MPLIAGNKQEEKSVDFEIITVETGNGGRVA
jgi:hypothetical protein